jgi:hypothetical protein
MQVGSVNRLPNAELQESNQVGGLGKAKLEQWVYVNSVGRVK